jgi:hypothetical protein
MWWDLLAVPLTVHRQGGERMGASRIATGPLVLRGSLIVLRRRCGKPGCHCATGAAHETPALSYSQEGRTRILTLRGADLAEVRAGLARYEAARSELEAMALSGIETLRARLAATKAGRRR